jgi:hypothetical protein
MKLFILLPAIMLCCMGGAESRQTTDVHAPVYKVKRLKRAMKVDANWNKPQWRNAKAISITNFIRDVPAFKPAVEAKMTYDDKNVYVIFRVQDRYVRSITTEPMGPVWKDAAVEFFFSPDTTKPETFFNLEMNCGGTALLGYRSKEQKPTADDVKMIEIAHSLPVKVDPEITDAVTWTIECRIPFTVMQKFSNVTVPKKGVAWRANFYKIAENNSNPHHMAWAAITAPRPNFHMPQFFGTVQFE